MGRLHNDISYLNKLAKSLLKRVDGEDVEHLRSLAANKGVCQKSVKYCECRGMCKFPTKWRDSKCYSQDALYVAKRFLKLLDKELDNIFLERDKL